MMNRLRNRKGFTLVECIIAIAVFGLLSLMVFMILTNAREQSKRADMSEKNLAQMIQNVVEDNSIKKYNSVESKTLNLTIENPSGGASNNFSVTYDLIDGYKSFLVHETRNDGSVCKFYGNSTEFMSSTQTTYTEVLKEDFTQANYYVCPKCNEEIKMGGLQVQLRCDDCLNTGTYNDTSKFKYIDTIGNGGYECLVCHGTAVAFWDAGAGEYMSKAIAAEGTLSVSGMTPNSIKYGKAIDWDTHNPLNLDGAGMFTVINHPDDDSTYAGINVPGLQLRATLTCTETSSSVGAYHLRLDVNTPAGFNTTRYGVKIKLPSNYNVIPAAPATSLPASIIWTPSRSDEENFMYIRCSGTGTDIDFSLVCKDSGNFFEYDYNSGKMETNKEQGLYRWFKINPSVTRSIAGDVSSMLVSASGTDYVMKIPASSP